MSSQADQLVHDLKEIQNGKQKDPSHVYDDLFKLQQQKDPQQVKSELTAATHTLQAAGLLPGVIVSLGSSLGKAAVDALATRESTHIRQGHLFSAVGEMLNALKVGSDASVVGGDLGSGRKQKNESDITYGNSTKLHLIRDGSGNASKLTWQDGSSWEKQSDGKWNIKDAHGQVTSTHEGTINVDVNTHNLSVKAKSGDGYLLKPDGTKVVNDTKGRVTELDYKDGQSRKFEYNDKNEITKVTETNGNTWVRDDKGVFNEYDKQGHKTLRSRDVTPTVDGDGTYRVTNNKDQSKEIDYTDGSKLNYDNNGNVTSYKYPDGSTVDYHYTKGLIDSVKDRDNTTWRRDDKGLFHQYDQKGDSTGATATGSKFIPPTTRTNLYENAHTGVFDKLVGALGGQTERGGLNSPITPDAVHQGGLGDCYFLQAVSSVAAQDPEAIKKMIQDNHDGTYTVTFPGQPDKPITVNAPTQEELDRFAHYQDGTYVSVLEKAHRYLTGKTDKDDGGDPAAGLELMTGKKYHDEDIHKTNPGFWDFAVPIYGIYDTLTGGNQTSDDEVAKMLTKAFNNHEEVGCGTGKNQGPIGDHAWSVLGYDPATQTVTLRNPWGYLGFDPKKFPSVKDLGDGKFTMSLAEFHKNYEYITIQNH